MIKIMMMTMAMTMGSCCASPAKVQEGKTESKQEESANQTMPPTNSSGEDKHAQMSSELAIELKSKPIVQWTFFDTCIFVSIIGAVGFAAWKLLPRKE